MLDLTPETEALAHRIAEERNLTVDEAVRGALEVHSIIVARALAKDMSPEGIAARIAATDSLVVEMATLSILDPRPVQEIVDDINSL